jgi:hypothetical protein
MKEEKENSSIRPEDLQTLAVGQRGTILTKILEK